MGRGKDEPDDEVGVRAGWEVLEPEEGVVGEFLITEEAWSAGG